MTFNKCKCCRSIIFIVLPWNVVFYVHIDKINQNKNVFTCKRLKFELSSLNDIANIYK